MAYSTPKTSWIAADIPVASDFNRIENNTLANHDDIVAEVVARAADVDAEEAARIADVGAEETARIASDALLQPIILDGPVYTRNHSSSFAVSDMVVGEWRSYFNNGGGDISITVSGNSRTLRILYAGALGIYTTITSGGFVETVPASGSIVLNRAK